MIHNSTLKTQHSSQPLNGLSFDVEDWFQVENLKSVISRNDWDSCELRVVQNTRKILHILRNHNTRATFFVLGWIAEKCPDLVEEIAAEKHEIASHGYDHELVYNLTPEQFESDLRRSREVLESITHTPIMGYRAPSFSLTPKSQWAVDILKKAGFAYDSSIFPTSFHNRYGFNGTSTLPFRFSNGLVELPLSTYKLFGSRFPVGGGGYFRLLPFSLVRRLFRKLNSQAKSIIFYLHPWELDPNQPRMNIRTDYRFRHYINLHKTQHRLERLLIEFRFGTLSGTMNDYLPLSPLL
jgi:polysaccharide deacetylase family protein (PEP-CTERM system associated)